MYIWDKQLDLRLFTASNIQNFHFPFSLSTTDHKAKNNNTWNLW